MNFLGIAATPDQSPQLEVKGYGEYRKLTYITTAVIVIKG
jgi:hypothetical protein